MLLTIGLPTQAEENTAAYTWQNVTIVAGGFITGFVAHPSERGLYYVRTDIGGAYRWDAALSRWSPLQDWLSFAERNLLGVESLAVDPTDPKKLYLAAGTYTNPRTPTGAILRSTDQGRHFSITRLPFKLGGNEDGRFEGERLQVDPNHPQILVLGTRLDGLWRSADSGASWNRVRTFPATPFNKLGVTFTAFDRTSGVKGQPTPVLFAGVADPVENLLRSQDAGRSWKPVPGGPTGLFPNHGVFASDGTLYLSYTDNPGPNGTGNGAVWAYSPRTGRWRNITPEKPGPGGPQDSSSSAKTGAGGQGFGYGVVTVDPADPHILLASTIDRWHPGDTIFRSTDAGEHWVSLREGATRDDALAPYLRHNAATPPFGHWIGAAMIDPFDPAHILYGTGETIWESHDVRGPATPGERTHWSVGAPGLEETADLTLLSPLLPGEAGPHLYVGLGDIGCFRNDDFTHSPAGGAMKNPELSNCDALALAAQHPQEMVRVGRSWNPGPHGAVSHDGGLHWTPFAAEPPGGERGGEAAISADGRLLLWAVRSGPLALSSDAGAHWRTLTAALASKTAGDRLPLQVLADARKPESFWVYNPDAGELFSIAADGTATPASRSAPKAGQLRIPAQSPAMLWIASGTGLFHAEIPSGETISAWNPTASVAAAYAVGFGKGSSGAGSGPARTITPAIYLAGALSGTPEAAPPKPGQSRGGGIYRSLDNGGSWQRIDDPDHRFAWVEQITGDPRLFGRVYLGTNGRGVLWGDPAVKSGR